MKCFQSIRQLKSTGLFGGKSLQRLSHISTLKEAYYDSTNGIRIYRPRKEKKDRCPTCLKKKFSFFVRSRAFSTSVSYPVSLAGGWREKKAVQHTHISYSYSSHMRIISFFLEASSYRAGHASYERPLSDWQPPQFHIFGWKTIFSQILA